MSFFKKVPKAPNWFNQVKFSVVAISTLVTNLSSKFKWFLNKLKDK